MAAHYHIGAMHHYGMLRFAVSLTSQHGSVVRIPRERARRWIANALGFAYREFAPVSAPAAEGQTERDEPRDLVVRAPLQVSSSERALFRDLRELIRLSAVSLKDGQVAVDLDWAMIPIRRYLSRLLGRQR